MTTRSTLRRLTAVLVTLAACQIVWGPQDGAPQTPDLVARGRQALDADRVDEALAILDTAVAANPNDPAALAWLAGSVTASGSAEDAREALRFDQIVRGDFFAGMSGDEARFARAMQLCEETLARDPKHAEALVWHGAGLFIRARHAFQGNDSHQAADLASRGLAEMEEAVRLEPDTIAVRIVRGAVLLLAARQIPSPETARALRLTAVGDYEHVLGLQRGQLPRLSVHSRGELLAGPAEAWHRLGNTERSREYLRMMISELAGTPYQPKAERWLAGEAGRADTAALACSTGCHAK